MTEPVQSPNILVGAKRAQEPSQTGRENKIAAKQATTTDNMKKEEIANKTKPKGISNKGGSSFFTGREPNSNDVSNRRNYKSRSVPNTTPRAIDISTTTTPRDSFFASQIEAIMFAFGESRYIPGDILELMEETVRQFILFLIGRLLKNKDIEGSGQEFRLTLSDVIGLIQKDRRLTRRIRAYVKSVGVPVDDKYSYKDYLRDSCSVIRNLSVPYTEAFQIMETNSSSGAPYTACKDSESLNETTQNDNVSRHNNDVRHKIETSHSRTSLGNSEVTRKPSGPTEQQLLLNNIDIMSIVVNKAAASLSQVFSQAMYHEYTYCRKVAFTAGPSQQRNSIVVDRTGYFLQWLGTAQNGIHFDSAAVHALGYLSWEAIGLITQTSLVLRYMSRRIFSSKASGVENKHIGSADPRRLYCCTAQQFILALRHGLGTWLVLPLNDEELRNIAKELERKSSLGDRSTFDISSWHIRTVSQLQVFQLLDTLRFLRDIRRNGTYSSVLVNLLGDSLLGR
ncbi:hypothetical protein GpartN1_g4398.t1 [Galdieria partita]|uniref:Uncharacterized protein n=1 Tax=Galdieria partita TaxID=83374 RepID=A0A9C7URJ9_9RHOD|nr:hypothetical protein GpartN1_g4398.t1 [Galdieria partita]